MCGIEYSVVFHDTLFGGAADAARATGERNRVATLARQSENPYGVVMYAISPPASGASSIGVHPRRPLGLPDHRKFLPCATMNK